jgi:hypothetical protein
MKAFAILLVLVVFGLGALSTTSCLVTRRSEDFACNTNSDCTSDRTCEKGYCVQGAQAACPSPCSSCDLTAKTCKIECGASLPCGAVQCPAGFACTIRCSNANACGDIDCAAGSGCDITCGGTNSCRSINCGASVCNINCSGQSACPSIDCASSCKCDVSCNNTTNVCPSITCPMSALGKPCNQDGVAGEVCDSSAGPACAKC